MTTIRSTGGLGNIGKPRSGAPKAEIPKAGAKPATAGSLDGASVRSNWGMYGDPSSGGRNGPGSVGSGHDGAPIGPVAGGRPTGTGGGTGGVRPEDEHDSLAGGRSGGGGGGPDPGRPGGPPRDGASPAQMFAGGRGGGGGTGGYTADPPTDDAGRGGGSGSGGILRDGAAPAQFADGRAGKGRGVGGLKPEQDPGDSSIA